jgi:DNA-binding FadR family transcriptional regulator
MGPPGCLLPGNLLVVTGELAKGSPSPSESELMETYEIGRSAARRPVA